MTDTKPISSRGKNLGCLIFFFAIFILAGAAEFVFLFVPAAYHMAQARSWTRVPCEIVSSKLVLKPRQKSSNYAIQIRYRYDFAGNQYESDRYQFLPLSGVRDYSAQNAIVKRLRHGTWTTCFVDPLHPDQAVIGRGWTQNMWPVLITSMAFMGAGILFTVLFLKSGGQSKRAIPLPSEITRGELQLKPRMGPLGAMAGALFAALFFVGISSLFIHQFLDSWRRGSPQYFLGLFLIPFVLADLALITLAITKFLALFDPRPQLRLASGFLTPGAITELRWQFIGRYDRITRLRLSLQGREQATFQAGKNTRTATSIFSKSPIYDSTRQIEIQKGKASLKVPADTIHTFTAPNNKIVWLIQLQADITGLPDLNEEFPLIVQPPPTIAPERRP